MNEQMNAPTNERDNSETGQGQPGESQLRHLTKLVGQIAKSLEHFAAEGPDDASVGSFLKVRSCRPSKDEPTATPAPGNRVMAQ